MYFTGSSLQGACTLFRPTVLSPGIINIIIVIIHLTCGAHPQVIQIHTLKIQNSISAGLPPGYNVLPLLAYLKPAGLLQVVF